MTADHNNNPLTSGHRVAIIALLCLFGLCFAHSAKPRKTRRAVKTKRVEDPRVYLDHADELTYDEYRKPGVQIVKGHVAFRHKGANLTCDSAYYNEGNNTFEAFGHVRMKQGDTLSLTSDFAYYDGRDEMMRARHNVVLKHRKSTLYTDSLDYDRKFQFGYFFQGGNLIDGQNNLVSDWGEYNTQTREAIFYYDVRLKSPKYDIFTDTLHYDTRTSIAHILGPSRIFSDGNNIETEEGFYDTRKDQAQLYGRSTVVNGEKTLTGDSLYFDSKKGTSEGFCNVVMTDKKNKNRLNADYVFYNEQTGEALATRNAVVTDFSQTDTFWVHADTIKMFTFNIDTDSMYREMHCYNHVRAFRRDLQAVCDSLAGNSLDSCVTMYKDPIVWNEGRQLLGEVIRVYTNDSTIRWAHVIGQALSIEQMEDTTHYNQIASKEMKAFFTDGKLRQSDAVGNVQSIYYPVDDKDSSLIGLNYLETDTMRMYFNETRKLQRIWTCKFESTMYPITQIPPGIQTLPQFAWFDYMRPVDKDDIFVWRGKTVGQELKPGSRRNAPLQTLRAETPPSEATQQDGGEETAP